MSVTKKCESETKFLEIWAASHAFAVGSEFSDRLLALGAQTVEGGGSPVRFELNSFVATFHRPHPHKEAKPYQVRDARKFLQQTGVRP
ncbi:MAG: type II toxin-antitoxin system HicA family toxin [Deltaproteobacteria bacterium]|nr:type II toxin-antitoxin system HicA family toxin [Deltaproteobacteria bacterium]